MCIFDLQLNAAGEHIRVLRLLLMIMICAYGARCKADHTGVVDSPFKHIDDRSSGIGKSWCNACETNTHRMTGEGMGTINFPPLAAYALWLRIISSAKFQASTS